MVFHPLIKIGAKLTEEELQFPASSGEKGTGLETDIPDFKKKILLPPRVKLVQHMP